MRLVACEACGEDDIPCSCEVAWAYERFHPAREVTEITTRREEGLVELPPPRAEEARRLFGRECPEDAVAVRLELQEGAVAGLEGGRIAAVTRAGIVVSVDAAGPCGCVTGAGGRDVLFPWQGVRCVSLAYGK